MSDAGDVVTSEDVRDLNVMTLQRAGFFARVGGDVLVVVGAIGVVAWLWLIVRQQLEGGGFLALTDGSGGEGVSIGERLDAIAGTYGILLQAVLAVAVGLAVRLLAANLLSQLGVSLTGFEPGDPLAPDPEPEATDPTP